MLFRLMKTSLQIREPLCTFNWISLAVLSAEVITMLVAYGVHDYQQYNTFRIIAGQIFCELLSIQYQITILAVGSHLAFVSGCLQFFICLLGYTFARN